MCTAPVPSTDRHGLGSDMGMKPEQALKNWLVSGVPIGAHTQTIETTTGRGVPDLNLCLDGNETWIELKAQGYRPVMRPEQVAWLHQRVRSGGVAIVLHRSSKDPRMWNVHSPIKWDFKACGLDKVEIVTPPLASGSGIAELLKFIKSLHA